MDITRLKMAKQRVEYNLDKIRKLIAECEQYVLQNLKITLEHYLSDYILDNIINEAISNCPDAKTIVLRYTMDNVYLDGMTITYGAKLNNKDIIKDAEFDYDILVALSSIDYLYDYEIRSMFLHPYQDLGGSKHHISSDNKGLLLVVQPILIKILTNYGLQIVDIKIDNFDITRSYLDIIVRNPVY